MIKENYDFKNITPSTPQAWFSFYKDLLENEKDYTALRLLFGKANGEMNRHVKFFVPAFLSANQKGQYRVECDFLKTALEDIYLPLQYQAEEGYVAKVKQVCEDVPLETLATFEKIEEQVKGILAELEVLAGKQREQITLTSHARVMTGRQEVPPHVKDHYSIFGKIRHSSTMTNKEIAKVWASAIIKKVI